MSGLETQLDGLSVLVTGAPGGIGWATADAFAAQGCSLILHAHRHQAALRARLDAVSWRDRAHVVTADLRDPAAVDRMFDAARAHCGRIDVLIVNAGIWPDEDLALHEIPVARVREVLEVDLLGAIWSCASFGRTLAATGPRADGRGASIGLVGSTAGRFGERGHADYAIAKAGLYGLLRTLKNELPAVDPWARINLVEPGWTATPMAAAALESDAVITTALQTMALRQLARPEDVARALVVLASPALSRHVTGEVVAVAGGMEGRRLWGDGEIDPSRVRARLREP